MLSMHSSEARKLLVRECFNLLSAFEAPERWCPPLHTAIGAEWSSGKRGLGPPRSPQCLSEMPFTN